MAFDKAKVQQEAKQRFDELTKKREEIMSRIAPIRQEYDALVNKNREAEGKVAERMKKAQEGLYDVDQERAHYARLLPPPSEAPAAAPKEDEAAKA